MTDPLTPEQERDWLLVRLRLAIGLGLLPAQSPTGRDYLDYWRRSCTPGARFAGKIRTEHGARAGRRLLRIRLDLLTWP